MGISHSLSIQQSAAVVPVCSVLSRYCTITVVYLVRNVPCIGGWQNTCLADAEQPMVYAACQLVKPALLPDCAANHTSFTTLHYVHNK